MTTQHTWHARRGRDRYRMGVIDMTIPDYPDVPGAYEAYDPDRCPMCGDEDCEGCDADPEPDDYYPEEDEGK